MNIRTKLALAFSIIVIIIGIVIFFYLNAYLVSMLSDRTKNNLRIMAEMSEGAYFEWTETLKTRTLDWSSDGDIRNIVEKMISTEISKNEKARLANELSVYIKDKKMSYDPLVVITDIVDRDGIVIASSRVSRIGTDEGKEERNGGLIRFSEAIKAKFGDVFISNMVKEEDEDDRIMTHVTARIFSTNIGSDGLPVPLDAVLLIHFVKNDSLASLLNGNLQETHGGISGKAFEKTYKSGEVYIVNKDGFITTAPSDAGKDIVFVEKIDSSVVDSCFKEKKEISNEFVSHEGEKVFGATMCIQRDNIMLVVEVASSEIFAPLGPMRRAVIMGILLTITIIILFSLLLSSVILKPLDNIVSVAIDISNKKFGSRTRVKSKDELGYLATIFNNMLDKIEMVMKESKDLEAGLISERDKSASIIASISEGLFVVDKNYKIVLINSAAEKIFKITGREYLDKIIFDVFPVFKGNDLIIPEDRPITRTVEKGESVIIGAEDNFYFMAPSGKKFPVAMATSPIKTKELVGAVVVFSDITDAKLLDDAKASFISTASHQLRTPLTSIRWYAEMLIDGDVGTLNDSQKEFANEVYSGAIRLNDTINTLLTLSRMESGKLHSDPVDINTKSFFSDVAGELAPLISQKKLSVKIDIDDKMKVIADKFMLHEVVSNLLSNSIRYTNEGGEISFGCNTNEKETTCSIVDNGIGIPDGQKDKIFDKFFRAENALNKVPDGSGLGLNLVKQFVEKWGGKIWFESDEGKGTTFYFTIPPPPNPLNLSFPL